MTQRNTNHTISNKIVLDDTTLEVRLSELPSPLVFINGVFDILHRGHVAYLQAAREMGGSLVVGLNSDGSAHKLGKGPDRPLNVALDRAFVLAGMSSVSLVAFFEVQPPVALLKRVHPDLDVKGGDYDRESPNETYAIRSWGGKSLAIPFLDGYSTTSLVRNIRS